MYLMLNRLLFIASLAILERMSGLTVNGLRGTTCSTPTRFMRLWSDTTVKHIKESKFEDKVELIVGEDVSRSTMTRPWLGKAFASACLASSLNIMIIPPTPLNIVGASSGVAHAINSQQDTSEVSEPVSVDATTAAASITTTIEKVPLYTQRSIDSQPYSEVSRGFRLLRPYGFNEFEGAGAGYVVKFASLFDVDENVVVGSAAASADKTSITAFGSPQQLAEKLLSAPSRRGGRLVSARARETEGVVFYEFQFENPVDESLPRPRNARPSKIIELYELCVSRGRLWSVQATSNDVLFPKHEKTLRTALASFFPRL